MDDLDDYCTRVTPVNTVNTVAADVSAFIYQIFGVCVSESLGILSDTEIR